MNASLICIGRSLKQSSFPFCQDNRFKTQLPQLNRNVATIESPSDDEGIEHG